MEAQIIVDIDNTLWDFSSVLYEELRSLNPLIPPPAGWGTWDFFKGYISPATFYQVIEEIHKRQEKYGVYPDSKRFLKGLKMMGFRVVIASHRSKETEKATLNWLIKHGLPFDELHLSYDKSSLFHSSLVVVDDSPFVLQKARDLGLFALGLEYPWNRGNGFLLFKRLTDVLSFIEKNIFKAGSPKGRSPSIS